MSNSDLPNNLLFALVVDVIIRLRNFIFLSRQIDHPYSLDLTFIDRWRRFSKNEEMKVQGYEKCDNLERDYIEKYMIFCLPFISHTTIYEHSLISNNNCRYSNYFKNSSRPLKFITIIPAVEIPVISIFYVRS